MKDSVLYVALMTTSILCQLIIVSANEGPSAIKKDKKKLPKDPLYITEVDLENLYDEWEDSDDEPLPPDELPAHKRQGMNMPPAGENLNDLMKDPEKLMRASKKGKTVMAFVTVANNPTKQETELLTQRWQVGLTNSHMKCERFVVSDDRAIFVFEDGSLAFEAKDYFLEQAELKDYAIDNQVWQGKGYPVEYPNVKKPSESVKQATDGIRKPVKDEL